MDLNIAQRLKDLRAEFKFTQDTVAVAVGIKRTTYQAYEEGRATPSLQVYLNLSILYGFESINELLGITKSEKKKETMLQAYYRADPDKRRIVDFILNLNC